MIGRIAVLVFCSILFSSALVEGCTSDTDCAVGECCRKSIPIIGSNGCAKLGAYEERCGGQTMCPCLPDYECVLEEQTFINRFKKGNGTCQITIQTQQGTQRKFFIDV